MTTHEHPRTPERTDRLAPLAIVCALLASCGLGVDNEQRYQRAAAAFESGDARTAVIDAKTILQTEPDNVAARVLLGRAALAEGDALTAEKELRRAVELGADRNELADPIARSMLLQGKFEALIDEFDSDEARASHSLQVLIGDALLALRRPVEARDRYSQVLAADGHDQDAALGIARSYLAENNATQARATLDHVLEAHEQYVPAWLFSAQLHQVSGELDAALGDFDRARRLSEAAGNRAANLQAVFGMAETNFALGDIDAARRHTQALNDLAPGSISALQASARLAVADEKWNEARQHLSEILRRVPGNRFARTMLGAVHLQAGNLGQAEMYLSAAVAEVPGDGHARRLLAETRLRLNKADEAQAAIQPILEQGAADPQSLAMAARVSFLSGDFESAAEYLEQSARDNPATADVQLDLALAYLMAGRIDEAIARIDAVPPDEGESDRLRRGVLRVAAVARTDGLQAAVEEGARLRAAWPDHAVASVVHGALLAASGRGDEAREAFEAALAQDSANVNALSYLGQLDLRSGNESAAQARFRRILDVDSNNVSAMIALAGIAGRAEDLSSARDWLERARESDASSLAPRLLLGRLHAQAGEFDKAVAVLDEAVTANDGAAEAHNSLGIVKLAQGETAAALESFERAVDLAPESRDYRLNLARAYSAGGDDERARAVLETTSNEKLLEHVPSGVALAMSQARSGRMDAALRTAAGLRERHPDDAAPLALTAELHAMNGDWQAAIDGYDAALAKSLDKRFTARAFEIRRRAGQDEPEAPLLRYLDARPLDSDIRLMLAQHYSQHDEESAMAEYARVVELSPGNFVAANNLAWLYLTHGDPRAEDLARQAYALAPGNASVADTLGWILVRNGKLDEGIRRLRRASELADRPQINYHLAAALAENGEAAEARRILEDILASDTEFPARNDARALLASL